MNPRLIAYLRSLGLSPEASDEDAWEFFSGLRGPQRSIANALNYLEDDQQARTACDSTLRNLGVDPENPSQQLTSDDDDQGDGDSMDADAVRAEAVREEQQRQSRIRELAELAQAPAALVRTAIDDSQSVEEAQQAFLQHYRSHNRSTVSTTVGGGRDASDRQVQRDALVAAMMLREGVQDPTRHWPVRNEMTQHVLLRDRGNDPSCERAVERGEELRGLSMINLVAMALRMDGIDCEPSVMSIGAAIQRANQTRGATGTGTLQGMFTDSFTAILVAAYEEAPDSTEGWTNTRDVPNYHLNERPRYELGGDLTVRGRGGRAEMDDLSEALETYKVREYAKQFVIDEQDLINDAFGALGEWAPRRLGRAAARVRPDLVYSILLANDNMRDGTPLFDAAHNNLLSSSALAVETLEAARAAIRIQQENGVNLNLMGRYLIVPGQLESTAETLVVSPLVVMAGTADRVRGNTNSNARAGLFPVADARLDNGVTDPATGTTHAGSATTWFLSTEGSGHTIEVGYVSQLGRVPRVRTTVLTEGRFGVAYDVQHSVGAKAIDWRGLVKAEA